MGAANFHASFELHLPDFELAPEFELGSEMAVLFGASGAGKSMTLRTLAGLVKPDRGQIQLNGLALFDSEQGIDLPPQDRGIGYVPQHYALFPHQSVAKNIAFGLHDVSKAEREARVEELLKAMRLEEFADRKPGEISGGQQQRTALARALARRPALLLMDEPFAAVEEDLRAHLAEELRQVQSEFALSVLLVTHSRAEAYALAERLIVLSEGKVVQAGSRDEVFRKPSTPAVASLMGMTNILHAKLHAASDSEYNLEWEGSHLRMSSSAEVNEGSSAAVGIRPEEIRVLPENSQAEGDNRVKAKLLGDTPQGADHLLKFRVNEQILDVRVAHPEFIVLNLAPDQSRVLEIPPTALHLIPHSDL